MKISTFILLVLLFSGCNQPTQEENMVVIEDHRNIEATLVDSSRMKPGDVLVYQDFLLGEGYSMVFFSDLTGKIN